MKENKTKPDIRFKGFTEAWEQRKFSDLYVKVNEKNDLIFGTDKIISVANMYYKEDVKESSDDYMKTYNVMRLGDIAFEGNKSKSYAHGRFVENTIGDGIVSHVFDVFRPIVSYDLNYWKYFINNENVMGRTMARCTKSSTMMTNLVANDFLKENVLVPAIEEQSKIGAYFANLDSLITLHQRECDQLKELKKSMLKKMFPRDGSNIPEVRFAGFTDAWEQRKLNEIVRIYDGVHQTPKYQDSGIMFLSVENISTLQSTKYISEEDFKRDYKVYPQENDILMTRIGDVGTTNVVTDNSLKAYYVSLALLKYKNTNPYFLSNAMQSDYVQKGLANRTLKTAVPMKINKDEIGKVDIILSASVEEQSKIGSYFKNIDNLITLHQRELEILKNLKKTCLKRMFI